jgi:hypothetical protein
VYNTGGTVHDPQQMLPTYLTHNSGKNIVQMYLNSTAIAQTVGKPFVMFETNTASCGGFVGISDAFVASLWGLDYGLTMAYSNFTGALFHVGGQNAYYNVSLFLTGKSCITNAFCSLSHLHLQISLPSANGRLASQLPATSAPR